MQLCGGQTQLLIIASVTQQPAIDRPCLLFPCYGEIRRLRAAAGISFLQTYQVSADFMMNSQSGQGGAYLGNSSPP